MTRLLYQFLLYPLAFVLIQLIRPFLSKKLKEMIRDKNNSRFEIIKSSREEISKKKPIWIHAASGEIEYARPVIRELKMQFPDIPIIVTHSSPSAKKILSSISDIDAWGALPWDFKISCNSFLKKWNPRCFLIARTDVWPVIATCCHNQNIPSLLFSATFAENSSRLKGVSGKITKWALNQLSEIQCVSEADAAQVLCLKIKTKILIKGDTRFDQVFYRLQNPKPIKDTLRPHHKNILVAGSTWLEDEQVIVPAFAKVKDSYKLIIAPHEIHKAHLESLTHLLQENKLASTRYSETSIDWNQVDVLIIDQVGILAELYTWGSVAFVGGSFKKQVHSVMEPLAAGLPVIVGPHHHNNREALHFKNVIVMQVPIVQEMQNHLSFSEALKDLELLNSKIFHDHLLELLQQHGAATKNVVTWCQNAICGL